MTVSPATARQPSLITPLNSLLSVLDLTGEIIDFTLTQTCPAKGQPSQFLVNAAPCRMLAWGKSLLNVKSCVSPTGPDHIKNRETVFSDHCHQTGPVSGGRRDRNVCQTNKCPECGTCLPVGSRLTPFRDLGSLGGLDPR